MRRSLPVLLAVCAWAQSGIEVPALGWIVDPSGALRPVQGVAGNFLLAPATLSGVLSAACSERLCLAKTASKILSASGEAEAPGGPAVVGMDGNEAIVFFPEPRTFALWHGDLLDALDWKVEGEVLSIRPRREGDTEIAVRREGQVWIVHPDGAVAGWIANATGPVLLLAEGVLFATPDEIILRRQDAGELKFPLAGAQTVSAMGPHYAAIRAGDTIYALRTEPARENLFLLPGNPP